MVDFLLHTVMYEHNVDVDSLCPSQINHTGADVGRVTSRYRVVRNGRRWWQIPAGHLAAVKNLWRSGWPAGPLTVTMRDPGDDFDLARGFLVSEGWCQPTRTSPRSLLRGKRRPMVPTRTTCSTCPRRRRPSPRPSLEPTSTQRRRAGVVRQGQPRAVPHHTAVARRIVIRCGSRRLRSHNAGETRGAHRVFDRTGGLHAPACSTPGDLLCVRGHRRHNA